MEIKQLSQEELEQVRSIQEKHQNILLEFGQIELLKLELKDRKDNVVAYLEQVKEEEKTLSEFLEQKYGKVSINLETGEITALE